MAGARSLALTALSNCGGAAAARAWHRGRARILAYHGVDPCHDEALNFDGFQVAPEVFTRQLRYLARHYRVLGLEDLVARLAGEGELPPNAVAITFDDGYANNARVAAPILKALGLPATFFLTTGFLDGSHRPWWYRLRNALRSSPRRDRDVVKWERALKGLATADREHRLAELEAHTGASARADAYPFMSWEEARTLAAGGFTVAAHTVSHPSLGAETPEVAAREIRESIARVAKETGTRATIFSYPYGRAQDIGPSAEEAVRTAGCRAAVTTTSHLVSRRPDLLRLPRLCVTGRHHGAGFAALVSGLRESLGGF